jgi:anti-sigma regulatory factor (Ser/Thr protein kinase)
MHAEVTEHGVVRRFRRTSEAAPAARAFVRRWLPDAPGADELVLGAAEAINNAIDHGDGPEFEVTVDLSTERGTVRVTDAGPGFDPPAHPTMPAPLEDGHRGLAVMDACVDDVDVASDPAGTTVTLQQGFDPGTDERTL